MHQRISVTHIALMLVGLLIVLIVLSGVVDAQEPESTPISEVGAGEAPGGQGVPRRHVLGDGVPDTPLELDMLHKQQDGITE